MPKGNYWPVQDLCTINNTAIILHSAVSNSYTLLGLQPPGVTWFKSPPTIFKEALETQSRHHLAKPQVHFLRDSLFLCPFQLLLAITVPRENNEASESQKCLCTFKLLKYTSPDCKANSRSPSSQCHHDCPP